MPHARPEQGTLRSGALAWTVALGLALSLANALPVAWIVGQASGSDTVLRNWSILQAVGIMLGLVFMEVLLRRGRSIALAAPLSYAVSAALLPLLRNGVFLQEGHQVPRVELNLALYAPLVVIWAIPLCPAYAAIARAIVRHHEEGPRPSRLQIRVTILAGLGALSSLVGWGFVWLAFPLWRDLWCGFPGVLLMMISVIPWILAMPGCMSRGLPWWCGACLGYGVAAAAIAFLTMLSGAGSIIESLSFGLAAAGSALPVFVVIAAWLQTRLEVAPGQPE